MLSSSKKLYTYKPGVACCQVQNTIYINQGWHAVKSKTLYINQGWQAVKKTIYKPGVACCQVHKLYIRQGWHAVNINLFPKPKTVYTQHSTFMYE